MAGIWGFGDSYYPQIPKSPHLFILLLLLALWLRLPALFANTFHPDEALFASWARLIAVWRDPLLQGQAVDKPPLLFYLQAMFYPLFGPVAWAARMPNFIASILLLPLAARWSGQLYRDRLAAILAALLVALSPFTVQFSATAFTDPLLAALLLAALLAIGSAPAWAGLWFGLAVATKYQAWLFLPLLAGLAAWRGWHRREVGRWLAGLLPLLLLLLVWEWARTGGFSLWPAQMAGYGGLRPSWSWELWPRLVAWLQLWAWVPGSPLMGVLLLLGSLLLAASLLGAQERRPAVDGLLLLFLATYFLLHWLLAVPVWDRYLLPVVPPAAVLAGRLLSRLLDGLPPALVTFTPAPARRPGRLLLLLFLIVVHVPVAAAARDGRYPIGGQVAADGGAGQAAAFLAGAPYGTVLYDHWWSWHWRYYFFDQGVYVSWFPHPAALVEDLTVFGGDGHGRYLALPASGAALPVQRAVTDAGFHLLPVFSAENADGRATLVLYRIEAGSGLDAAQTSEKP